jgi:hypothetical protein
MSTALSITLLEVGIGQPHSQLSKTRQQLSPKGCRGIVRHGPPSSKCQLFVGWIHLLQVFEVLVVGSTVDCCVELEADLFLSGWKIQPEAPILAVDNATLPSLRKPEIYKRRRSSVEPIRGQTERRSHLTGSCTQRLWQLVQLVNDSALDQTNYVEIPGRTVDEAEKQQAAATDCKQFIGGAAILEDGAQRH